MLLDNPNSPNCTTIAHLIDSALGAFTKRRPVHDGLGQQQDRAAHGHGHRRDLAGQRDLPVGCELRTGPGTNVMEAYPPPVATNGAHVTGSIGGGLWMVTSHTKQPKAAAALVQYMDTSPKIQGNPTVTQGLPAYAPDQDAWLSRSTASSPTRPRPRPRSRQAAGEIWTGWSPVPWSVESIFGNTVTPGLLAGGTFTSALGDARREHQVRGAERRLAGQELEAAE